MVSSLIILNETTAGLAAAKRFISLLKFEAIEGKGNIILKNINNMHKGVRGGGI